MIKKMKDVVNALIIPGAFLGLFLLPTLFQDQNETVKRGRQRNIDMISCYTDHYRDILHFALQEKGIINKELENSLYDLRYKKAEDFIDEPNKFFNEIFSLKIPSEFLFCDKCYQYGIANDSCKKIYEIVVYIEQMDPPPVECIQR